MALRVEPPAIAMSEAIEIARATLVEHLRKNPNYMTPEQLEARIEALQPLLVRYVLNKKDRDLHLGSGNESDYRSCWLVMFSTTPILWAEYYIVVDREGKGIFLRKMMY